MIIGGVNGAGKSTLTTKIIDEQSALAAAKVLNPDAFTNELIFAGARPGKAADFGGLRRVRELLAELIASRETFIAETVLANSAYGRLALQARERGFGVRLFYVGVPTIDIALERIANRVAEGGHSVPEADVRRRWKPSHRHLAWFAQHVEEVRVFSNAVFGGAAKEIACAQNGAVAIFDEKALPAVTAVLRPLVSSR